MMFFLWNLNWIQSIISYLYILAKEIRIKWWLSVRIRLSNCFFLNPNQVFYIETLSFLCKKKYEVMFGETILKHLLEFIFDRQFVSMTAICHAYKFNCECVGGNVWNLILLLSIPHDILKIDLLFYFPKKNKHVFIYNFYPLIQKIFFYSFQNYHVFIPNSVIYKKKKKKKR
jgi:hypothetical protein